MPYDTKAETGSKEEIAFKLMSFLIKADEQEIDRVLRLYARCARVVENPGAAMNDPRLWELQPQAH